MVAEPPGSLKRPGLTRAGCGHGSIKAPTTSDAWGVHLPGPTDRWLETEILVNTPRSAIVAAKYPQSRCIFRPFSILESYRRLNKSWLFTSVVQSSACPHKDFYRSVWVLFYQVFSAPAQFNEDAMLEDY